LFTKSFSIRCGYSASEVNAPINQESPRDPSFISVGSIYFLKISGLISGFFIKSLALLHYIYVSNGPPTSTNSYG
jgi:hypothetical protein